MRRVRGGGVNALDNPMVRGYFAGRDSASNTLPDCHKNESPAFKHGWLNGRDDRIGKPRDVASVLRRCADMIDGAFQI